MIDPYYLQNFEKVFEKIMYIKSVLDESNAGSKNLGIEIEILIQIKVDYYPGCRVGTDSEWMVNESKFRCHCETDVCPQDFYRYTVYEQPDCRISAGM